MISKNEIEVFTSAPGDKEQLAEIRILAMRESLEALGRFDLDTARQRFTKSFDHKNTKKIFKNGQLIGFYVLNEYDDHLMFDHFYIHPAHQSGGVGSHIMDAIIEDARIKNLSIRLGALKGSRSNAFYQKHGFQLTHDEQWDNYYELNF